MKFIVIFFLLSICPVFAEGVKCKKFEKAGTGYLYCPATKSYYAPIQEIEGAKDIEGLKDRIRQLKIKNAREKSVQKTNDSSISGAGTSK